MRDLQPQIWVQAVQAVQIVQAVRIVKEFDALDDRAEKTRAGYGWHGLNDLNPVERPNRSSVIQRTSKGANVLAVYGTPGGLVLPS
jgi:hypothetical protein